MEEHGMDALIFAANDYRGHKGALRWIADVNLAHRSGNAVKFRGEEPTVVLSGSLSGQRRPASAWVNDYRFPGTIGQGLIDVLAERPTSRVGVVGLGQVMKVDEYLALRTGHPDVEFIDWSDEFEVLRAVKSPLELRGAEESAYILDQCFARLLEIARPGITEREIAAEMHRVGHLLGGEDPLFLTMHTDYVDDAPHPTFGAPRDRVLRPHSVLAFSYEIVGPLGYWTELSRMVTFAPPSADDERIARAVTRGIRAGASRLKVGVRPSEVQHEVLAAVEAEGGKTSYWSGHSLGLDVLESPWVGLDVVEDGDQSVEMPIGDGFVMTLHPMVTDGHSTGYMADTFIVSDDGARKLSKHATGLYRLSNGEVDVDEF